MHHARFVARRLAATLTAAVIPLAVVAAGPASADSQSHADDRQDVVGQTEGGDPTVVPGDRARDIVWSKATYGNQKLNLLIEVRELASSNYSFTWDVKDPSGRWWVTYQRTDTATYVYLQVAGGDESPCSGLTHARSDSTDRVRVTVPRSCLGAPKWVRYGVASFGSAGDEYRYDDGRLNGSVLPGGAKLGPQIAYN